MAYVKKISAKQFSLDVVDFMLKKYNITHEDIEKLPHRPENKDEWDDTIAYQENWFQFYTFDSPDEYMEYMEYFYEHYKDYAPQWKWKRRCVEDTFAGFDLMYGLKTNYDFELHIKMKNEIDMYNKVFGKNKKQ